MILSEEDLRERSEKLHEAQQLYEDLAFLYTPKMPCPECTGSGQVYGGSLGNICPRCFGQRVVDRPAAEQLELPDFASMRRRITAYGDVLADQALPSGHRAKKHLVLPAASSVPELSEIEDIIKKGNEKAKELRDKQLEIEGELAEPEKPKGLLSEDGDLGEYTDAELDEMEKEDTP